MTAPLFSLRDVGVRFGGLRALNRFSMDVAQGAIHALIGPNGAGKSTVFNCVSRFYRPSEGDILFEGESLLRVPAHGIAARGIARTFQNIELCRRMTVLENVLIGMAPRVPGYFPFAPSRKRAAAECDALVEADALLERTGLMRYRDTPAEELDFGHQKMLDLHREAVQRTQSAEAHAQVAQCEEAHGGRPLRACPRRAVIAPQMPRGMNITTRIRIRP